VQNAVSAEFKRSLPAGLEPNGPKSLFHTELRPRQNQIGSPAGDIFERQVPEAVVTILVRGGVKRIEVETEKVRARTQESRVKNSELQL
jgi:hypothetical protein